MSYSAISDDLTNIINSTNRVRYEQGRQRLGSDQIGKDGFMQLLLAQLMQQDPMDPVDNKEFLSQQALLTQIEKLDDLNTTIEQTMQLSQAASWVGKNVEYKVEGQEEPKTGFVDSVKISSDGIGLEIDGETIPPQNITKIFAE